ncbi:antitoxin VbhA family protein [Phaeobacter sp. JH20_18]|uniref:antitoxin VbhA family protein n=1 Tax=Phaeobacter sp. JH20_18 TaxID=3112476 RepID=UPI003A8A2876
MLEKVLDHKAIPVLGVPMNVNVINGLISPDEIARRRKIVAKADWSMRMEGLGKQTGEYDDLSELWITGQISKAELDARTAKMVTDYIRARGH